MLKRIDMVALYVREWASALRWYEDALGFSKLYVEDDHQFAVLGLPDGGAVLHLVGSSLGDAAFRNRCAPNILVDDFDETLEALRRRGVEIREVQNDDEDGYRLARIADPEGNDLNLYVYA
jgi:catechol 2,3-dioxygenase-like lactoylglutathione lyase family enzyme